MVSLPSEDTVSREAGPLVSIVVPAFNVEEWIGQCIQSLLDQTYQNIEILVIDDGSEDKTADVIDDYSAITSKIRCVRQTNSGQSAARNRGLDLATGDVVMFLDADDWFYVNTVSSAVERLKQGEADVVVFQAAKFLEQSGKWFSGTDDFYWRKIANTGARESAAFAHPEFLSLYPLPQMKAFTRSFLVRHKLRFQEGVKYEDNSFHVDVYSKNPSIAFLPEPLIAWRVGRTGQTTANAYPGDCIRVLSRMAETSLKIPDEAMPYILIQMIKLVISVSQTISTDSERPEFIDRALNIIRTIHSQVTQDLLEAAVKNEAVLLGDFLLVELAINAPTVLAHSMDSGLRKYIALSEAAAKAVVSTIKVGENPITQAKSLCNYSQGKGDTCLTGLGPVRL